MRPSSHERRRVEDRHDFAHHLVARAEPLRLVTAERVLDGVDETLVAIGAGTPWAVFALREHLYEVVVGDQRPGDGDGIAQSAGKRLLDDRRGLKSAGAQNGNFHGLLDAMRVG